MFDFAIVLRASLKDIILLQIRAKLHDLDFKSVIVAHNNQLLLLVRQQSSRRILETLASLKIEKIKHSKRSPTDNKGFKYKQFVEARSSIDAQVAHNETFSKFKYQDRHKFVVGCRTDTNDDRVLESCFEAWEREMAIYQILSNVMVDESFKNLFDDDKVGKLEYLFVYLKKKDILVDLCPLPQVNIKADAQWAIIVRHLQQGRVFDALSGVVESTCQQYGQQVAIYFHFLLFLVRKMAFLVLIGMLTYALDEVFDEDVNTSPFETIYAMVVIVWGSLFVGQWKQEELKVRIRWRSIGKNYQHYEHTLNQSLIKCLSHDDHELFDHEQQIDYERSVAYSQLHQSGDTLLECEVNGVTGLKTPKKTHNMYLLYGKSALKSLPYLVTVASFLIVSLNVRGYVLAEHTWIYFPWLAQLSDDGAFLDKNSQMANLTTMIHVMFIYFLNEKYKEVSIESSLLERHESYHAFEASLIVKRFAFEMLSGFLDFFYIGFIRFDIIALKIELLSMFTFDEIRRLIFETIIPSMQKMSLDAKIRTLMGDAQTLTTLGVSEDYKVASKVHLHRQLVSIYLPKYESFDDYLEVVLNFGYLMFFTSAYPLAGIVIALFLVVEFLSDNYKIHNLYQKPLSMAVKGIGPWIGSMDMICILSVFSNLILFAFASDKIAEFFPSLFQDAAHHHQVDHMLMATPKVGAGRYIAIIVFLIEHVLFLTMYAVRTYIKNQTNWTDTYLARQVYKKSIRIKN